MVMYFQGEIYIKIIMKIPLILIMPPSFHFSRNGLKMSFTRKKFSGKQRNVSHSTICQQLFQKLYFYNNVWTPNLPNSQRGSRYKSHYPKRNKCL